MITDGGNQCTLGDHGLPGLILGSCPSPAMTIPVPAALGARLEAGYLKSGHDE
jgi:hypothetical protein